MVNFINKNKLLATTAICAISVCVNTVKAEEIDILSILNNSATKSENISWEKVEAAGENIVQIGDEFFKYTWTNIDPNRIKYIERQEDTLSGDVNADFLGIYYEHVGNAAYGGALRDGSGSINTINGDFINNQANSGGQSALGGAVAISKQTYSSVSGNFIANSTIGEYQAVGGALKSYDIENLNADFIGNYTISETSSYYGETAAGGALYLGETTFRGSIIGNLTGNFVYNHVKGNYISQGGAIFTRSATLNFLSDARDILFYGNYVEDTTGKRYEAIYTVGANNEMTFTSRNGGSYTFYDYINGDGQGTINFVAEDGTGQFNLWNDIKGQANINFDGDWHFDMQNSHNPEVEQYINTIKAANKITINGNLTMAVDVDLATEQMDRLEADTMEVNGSIKVNSFKILADTEKDSASVVFAPAGTTGISTAEGYEVLALDYNYDITYNEKTGKFEFTKQGGKKPSDNPVNLEVPFANAATAVMADALASQVLERDINSAKGLSSGDAEKLSAWVETFGSDDDVKLKHISGDVDTRFYGIVGGIESRKIAYDNGFDAVYGVYGAYTNSTQKHKGDKVKQDGGYLGLSAALRKDVVFSNFTLTGGYLKNEASTVWGKDKFDTKVISVANKTGVDLKMSEDMTLTPSLYVAYTGIDTEDYTNKAGVRIQNKFTNVLTLAPEFKLSKDFGNDFKGYAKVAYKYFSYDNNVKANGILLPEMGVKPYVEYGVGAEKDWTDRDTKVYGEVTRHDGGREGWNVNLGLNLDF